MKKLLMLFIILLVAGCGGDQDVVQDQERQLQDKLERPGYCADCSVSNKCIELISGHNDVNSNRINIIFGSIGRNISTLRAAALDSVDFDARVLEGVLFDSTGNGLMAYEPFASNKNRFNFWYVNKIGDPQAFNDEETVFSEEDTFFSECDLPAPQRIMFGDGLLFKISHASMPTSTKPGVIRIRHDSPNIPGIVVHEMGHSLGGLHDQRPEDPVYKGRPPFPGDDCYYSSYVRCTTDQECKEGICAGIELCSSLPEALDDCRSNAPWADLIGNGCGQDGIVDCPTTYVNITQEVCETDEGVYVCRNRTKPALKNIEVDCFFGCNYQNLYRSTEDNMMISSTGYHNFGPVNQRILCRQIEHFTGSAGGICNDLCMEGCSAGERCINGACQDI